MLNTKQTAKELGVCEKTIFLWIKANKIKAIKIGRNYKISEDEVEFIKQNGIRKP